MGEMLAFQAVTIVCATAAFVASLRFLRRYVELRHERRLRAESDEIGTRLERIESAVETTALEVERISEANRFLAKLLSDRAGPATPPPSKTGRVITPH
jgi:hypothetical protein